MNRSEVKEALAPSVKAFAKEKGWDEAKTVEAVGKAIDSMKNDG
jgi:hypothetical protein